MAVAALCALVTIFFAPVLFSREIFFYRDLAAYFYPQQQFASAWINRGVLPLWNPFSSYGQPFQADPVNQLFYPTTLLRLLLPFNLAFKLEVILHFYLAGVSCFFLARRLGQSAAGAFLAGVVLVFCGPFVSLGNFLNFLSTAAWIPLALLLTHRAVARVRETEKSCDDSHEPAAVGVWRKIAGAKFLWLGAVFAVQFFAGEPVTLLVTILLCAGFTFTLSIGTPRDWRTLARVAAGLAVCGAFSLMLSAVQLLPFLSLLLRTYRGQSGLTYEVVTFWSLHPLSLPEFFVASFFDDLFSHSASSLPWLRALNSGREPFLLSLYFGFIPIVLALLGALRRKKAARFFAIASIAALFLALGVHNPLHRWLYDHVFVLRSMRYPVKFVLVAAVGVSILSGFGFDRVRAFAWRDVNTRRAKLLLTGLVIVPGGLLLAMLTGIFVFPSSSLNLLTAFATRLGIADAHQAARELASSLPARLIPAIGMLLPLALALFIRRPANARETRLAAIVLFVLAGATIANLTITHRVTNPLGPVEIFARSIQTESVIPRGGSALDARIYVDMGILDEKGELLREKLAWMPVKDGWSQEALLAASSQDLLQFSAHRGIYTAISTDWTALLPLESYELRRSLAKLGQQERDRLLGLTGVRYEIRLSPSPNPRVRLVAELPMETGVPIYFYENPDWVPRAYIAEKIELANPSGGTAKVFPALIEASKTSSKIAVIESGTIPVAATDLNGANGSATVTRDSLNQLAVRAELDGDGFLVVSDSFDPDWRVNVDGTPGTIVRANWLFRGVKLSKGVHSVEFSYRPSSLHFGAGITLLTLSAALIGWCSGWWRRAARPDRSWKWHALLPNRWTRVHRAEGDGCRAQLRLQQAAPPSVCNGPLDGD